VTGAHAIADEQNDVSGPYGSLRSLPIQREIAYEQRKYKHQQAGWFRFHLVLIFQDGVQGLTSS
jgi:hypothetical protein